MFRADKLQTSDITMETDSIYLSCRDFQDIQEGPNQLPYTRLHYPRVMFCVDDQIFTVVSGGRHPEPTDVPVMAPLKAGDERW